VRCRQLMCHSQGEETRLGWSSGYAHLDIAVPPVLLGLQTTLPTLPSTCRSSADPRHELNLDESWRFEDARTAATSLSAAEAWYSGQSRAQLDWHRRHQFCSVCGQRTEPGRGGQVRKCMACKADHFPRTDPVVIMVVTDGDGACSDRVEAGCRGRGHTRRWPGSWTRGVHRRSGSARSERGGRDRGGPGAVSFLTALALPSSLMIGCHARALTTDIHIDDEEMTMSAGSPVLTSSLRSG